MNTGRALTWLAKRGGLNTLWHTDTIIAPRRSAWQSGCDESSRQRGRARPCDLSLSAAKHVDALPVDNGALPPDLPCASDFGVASAVEMSKGQAVTVVDADSASRRWLGFETRIADSRFFPICRTQLNLAIKPLDHPFAFSTAA